MACRCSPSLLTLKDQLNVAHPLRDRTSDGCCGDPAHQARSSDHNADGSGFAHALDVDEDLDGASAWSRESPAPLFTWLPDLLADERTKYDIYEGLIYYADCRVHGKRCFFAGGHVYTGPNAHRHHLHHSIHSWATHDTRLWPLPPRPLPVPTTPGGDMPAPLDITSSVDWPDGGFLEQSFEGGLYSYAADGTPSTGSRGAPILAGYNTHREWHVGGPRGFFDLDLWIVDGLAVGVIQVSTKPGERYGIDCPPARRVRVRTA